MSNTHNTAKTRFLDTNGVRYAYRTDRGIGARRTGRMDRALRHGTNT
jgi:hypothetical protein